MQGNVESAAIKGSLTIGEEVTSYPNVNRYHGLTMVIEDGYLHIHFRGAQVGIVPMSNVLVFKLAPPPPPDTPIPPVLRRGPGRPPKVNIEGE